MRPPRHRSGQRFRVAWGSRRLRVEPPSLELDANDGAVRHRPAWRRALRNDETGAFHFGDERLRVQRDDGLPEGKRTNVRHGALALLDRWLHWGTVPSRIGGGDSLALLLLLFENGLAAFGRNPHVAQRDLGNSPNYRPGDGAAVVRDHGFVDHDRDDHFRIIGRQKSDEGG